MEYFLASLCLLESLLRVLAHCIIPASEFQLKGDYLVAGLFDIHHVSVPVYQDRPEAIDCSRQPFFLSNYRRFQLMRFSVEEINNSTDLLPNVSLGYEIFDHCSDIQSFPGILKILSVKDLIQPWNTGNNNASKVMAVVGPFTSTDTRSVAPLFMVDLFPLVSYGAASSAFAEKAKYPSFLRTVHTNKDSVELIVQIMLHFNWSWVAFLHSDDDYGTDGLEMFKQRIKDTKICLAYTQSLHVNTDCSQAFRLMESQNINIIIAFVPEKTAEALIYSAIKLNITNKVWIAADDWSLNKNLPTAEGIKNIGTVMGISQPVMTIPGFSDFIHSTKNQIHCESKKYMFCNQDSICTCPSAEEILAVDPSYSFPVYAAVYAIAHALHNSLHCGVDKCNGNITLYPHMVLTELKKSNFTLLNQTIRFDENGDPTFGSYSVVFWNNDGLAEEVGFYKFYPSAGFFINSTKIQWHTHGKVPTSFCSPECHVGYAKKQNGIHKCCYNCEICPIGTYINVTEDPYKCISCEENEWSADGSTSCRPRVVEYVQFTDTEAVLIMVGACVLVGLTLAMCVLFAINYNTPIVRSAGGPMCFLILGCHSLCSISVFFYFDKPTNSYCILRMLPFLLFYTVCLACFVVRSFQIVCIFKIAAKFPKIHSWWMKYHGQWFVITAAFVTQAGLLLIGCSVSPPKPFSDISSYPDKIILGCNVSLEVSCASLVLILSLGCLCFIFSYMGKDLPKNYNEAKTITFCLLLLILTWIIFTTEYMLYRGKHIPTLNALAILSSIYSFLLWYFLPKCYIIVFQPHKNTQKYFQGIIQDYTKTISQ